MLIGYARASTDDQLLDLQRDALAKIGCERVFEDTASGAKAERVEPESILTEDAIDLLATKLRTPLQIQLHLSMALEAGYLTGEKPVSAELVESVLSRQLDDLEPTLTRHGYRIKDLVEQFDARPTEIKALFSNALDPAHAAELRDKMLAAGLPI